MAGNGIDPQKSEIRAKALAKRRDQPEKDELSRRIVGAFMSLPEYAVADTILFYVDVRSEVRTRIDLQLALESGKTIVVPWCSADSKLELFRLTHIKQLKIGMYGILEPSAELRTAPEHRVHAREIDLVMVPGVCFDYRGARIGHGKGYYDRLLATIRPDTPRIALAFECQMFEHIPTDAHDQLMDTIITEERIYQRPADVTR